MSRTLLAIEIADRSAALTRALGFLKNDARLRVVIQKVKDPNTLPEPGVLRIEPASLLHPSLVVLWRGSSGHAVRDEDVQAGLTELVWEGGTTDTATWLESARPLPRYVRLGTPNPDRPWALLGSSWRVSRTAPQELARLTGFDNPQPHELAGPSTSLAPDLVIWPPLRSTLAALLGHIDAVVAPPGPLSWDARRLGVPVFEPPLVDEAMANVTTTRLASIVPPALVEDAAFWRDLATDLLRGEGTAGSGTLERVLAARALAGSDPRPQSRLARMRRKVRKLQRDPRAFLADSWLVRGIRRT